MSNFKLTPWTQQSVIRVQVFFIWRDDSWLAANRHVNAYPSIYVHIETHTSLSQRFDLHSHFIVQYEFCNLIAVCIFWQQQENNIPAIGFGKLAPAAYLLALVHLAYNDEAASETFCLYERCAPGCITCLGRGEGTGLPNVTSTGGTPPCMTLLLATGLPILFMKAGRWEPLTVREHELCCSAMRFFPH